MDRILVTDDRYSVDGRQRERINGSPLPLCPLYGTNGGQAYAIGVIRWAAIQAE